MTYHHPKELITVADAPVVPGYIFSGWSSEQVTPGIPTVLSLNPGTYYITEVGGDLSGFTHSVYCDVPNGIVDVSTGSYDNLTFTNTYVAVQLEKDNHFGYVIGYPDGTVRPESNITRAEVATIFFRMLKEDSLTFF